MAISTSLLPLTLGLLIIVAWIFYPLLLGPMAPAIGITASLLGVAIMIAESGKKKKE